MVDLHDQIRVPIMRHVYLSVQRFRSTIKSAAAAADVATLAHQSSTTSHLQLYVSHKTVECDFTGHGCGPVESCPDCRPGRGPERKDPAVHRSGANPRVDAFDAYGLDDPVGRETIPDSSRTYDRTEKNQ
jgi:hypothetical protein